MVKTDRLLSTCNMKHYLSKAMIEQKIERLRKEISDYEIKNLRTSDTPKSKRTSHITKLRQELHESKLLLNIRTNQTILKNGRK